MTDIPMPIEIIDDERSRAMACINAWLQRDQEGFDAAAGTDEEAATLLPVAIGELCTALEHLAGPANLRREVADWLEVRRRRLAD